MVLRVRCWISPTDFRTGYSDPSTLAVFNLNTLDSDQEFFPLASNSSRRLKEQFEKHNALSEDLNRSLSIMKELIETISSSPDNESELNRLFNETSQKLEERNKVEGAAPSRDLHS